METRNSVEQPHKHKDTLMSANSYETCKKLNLYLYSPNSATSSKILYKSKASKRSKVSLRIDTLEEEYFENVKDLMAIEENVNLSD